MSVAPDALGCTTYIIRGILYGSFDLEVFSKGYCILRILTTLVVLSTL